MRAGAAHGFARSSGKVACDEMSQGFGASDHRTEARGAEQVVTHPVTSRQSRLACEVRLGIEEIDCRPPGRILGVERAARERLEKKPGTSDRNACRSRADEGF